MTKDFIIMKRAPETVGGWLSIAEAGTRKQADRIALQRDDRDQSGRRLLNTVVWTRHHTTQPEQL